MRSLLRSADFLLSSSSTAFLPWDRVSDTESPAQCLFPPACLGSREVQSAFSVNHMNEVDRAWDACNKACSRDASAAAEELGYSAERHLVALETLNERPSFPGVLWLVGRLNRGSWTLPRRSPILVFLFRSLPQIAESGIPLRSRCQLTITSGAERGWAFRP